MQTIDFQPLLNSLRLANQSLQRIADALELLAPSAKAPNYQLPLEQWSKFDWASIGARVELSDNYGAAVVSWRGMQYQRRSPNNKFGSCIFFSRCTGRDDAGELQYEQLCTFKPVKRIEVEPLPEKVAQLVR